MLRIRNLLNLAQHSSKINSAFTEISPCTHLISQLLDIQTTCIPYRCLSRSSIYNGEKSSTNQTHHTLTEYNAYDMIANLSDNERASLSKALSTYNSDKIKSKFQGKFWQTSACLKITIIKKPFDFSKDNWLHLIGV